MWRADYVKSRFRAISGGARGRGAIIAEFESFDSPPSRPPEPSEAPRQAHEALVRRLHDLGWELEGVGEAWYEQRFYYVGEPAGSKSQRRD